MQIISALFVENFALRQAPFAAPSPVPVTIDPHLVVLIYCPLTEPGNSLLEVIFRTGPAPEDEQLARNVSPFTVEPGKFTYRLVRGELSIADYGQIFAHCRVGTGQWHLVPLTILPPVDSTTNPH
jgi:hypothetical protein